MKPFSNKDTAPRAPFLVTIYISVRRRDLSVCLSVTGGHRVVGFHSDLPVSLDSLTPIWLWHSDTQFPPNGYRYRYPNHPRLRIIPFWDSSLGSPGILGSKTLVDPRDPSGIHSLGSEYGIHSLGSQTPVDRSQTPVWDSLGFRIREFRGYSRILLYLIYQYQDVENQNSKHKIKDCRTISSSKLILKIDSTFLMALLY